MDYQIITIFAIYITIIGIYGIIVIRNQIKNEDRKNELIDKAEYIKKIINTGGYTLSNFVKNDLTLEESIQKPTEEETNEGTKKAINILSELIGELYSNYEFRRHDPTEDDKTSSNGLVMKITGANQERLDKLLELFTIYFRYKLEEYSVAKALKEEIEKGNVIPTGDVVIEGVLVSSPLRKPDIEIIIEFMDRRKHDKIQEIKNKHKEKLEKQGSAKNE